jgi:hypothetical protein
LENAKKNLVFHFGVGHHASFPQKPVVKAVDNSFSNIFSFSTETHKRGYQKSYLSLEKSQKCKKWSYSAQKLPF